eukprot:COSAG06_NODE_2404_length_6931_cov_35.420082_1_plen_167_part_00
MLRKLQVKARRSGVAAGRGGSSAFRGVSQRRSCRNRWTATINVPGKDMLFLGSFSDEVMAARSYDKAAKAIHKGNAKLNFPEEEDQLQGGEMQIVRNVRGGRQQRQEQQQNVDASASASGSSSRSRGGGGSELDSSSSSSSIEVHLGRRLEYRFMREGRLSSRLSA